MDTNNMDADSSANIAVANYSESENVCLVCGRNSKVSIETTSPTLENIKLFFECCSKYRWPEPLQKCLQRNLNEQENNCDLCTDCLSSFEKILEMYQLLEEMQNGIQNFIDFFAKQVLDYQNPTENQEYLQSKEAPDGNSFFEDACLEISQAIDKIEVDLGFETENEVLTFQSPTENCKNQENTPSIETSNGNSFFENTCLEISQAIDEAEVDMSFEQLLFVAAAAENEDDGIDIKDEPVAPLIENPNCSENNSDSSPGSVTVHEEKIDNYLTENDNEDSIGHESSIKGLSLLQEQIIICNYNSTNLGALCPLKNFKIVLKRLEFTNEEDSQKTSNDCAIPTDPKKLQCHICQRVFSRQSNLTRHIFIHQRDDGDPNFQDENSLPDSTENKIVVARGKRKAAETAMKKLENLERTISSRDASETESDSEKTLDLDSDSEYSSGSETAKEDDCNSEGVKQNTFHCKICAKIFSRKHSLGRHMLTHKKTPFNKNATRIASLKRYSEKAHKSGNSKTSIGSFECNICPKIFRLRKSLLRHLLIHEKTRFTKQSHQYIAAKRFNCTTCKFSCNSVKQLTVHNSETGHLNNEIFKCTSCPSVFTKLKDLSDHNLKIHNNRIWKCLICPKKFARRRNFARHHLLHRPNSFKCEICYKVYSRKSFLTRHTSTHTKKLSLYKCTICTETFQWKILMDDHLHVHNVGKFKCDTCGKEFVNKRILQQHCLIHKKNRVKRLNQCYQLLVNKKFQCRICRYTFLRIEHLKKHHMAHKEIWGKLMKMRKDAETTQESFDYRLTSMNLFECTICQTVFPKWPALTLKSCWKQHRDSAHKNTKYCECETCGKLFSNTEQLQQHKGMYTKEKETCQCDVCKEYFHTQSDFEVHKNRHSNCQKGAIIRKIESSYECGVCDKVFNEKPLRRRHFKSHVGTRLQCKMCNKSVDRKNFMTHWKDHTSPKDFKCDICNLGFDGENKLSIHKMRVHSDERPYKCSICPSTFKFVGYLNQHEEAVHMNKKLVCEFCGIILGNRKRLLEHRKRHINTYHCKLCDKNYTSRSGLSLHNKTVHSKDGKRFQCEFCPKVFFMKQNCESHRRVHTGEKPFACDKCNNKFATVKQLRNHTSVHEGVKFPCKVCGKILKTITSLTSHVNLQHNDNIFQCEICGKKCKRKDNLITHLRSHNGEKPYQCQECGKSFTRLDNLNVHLKWHEKVKTLKTVNNVANDESESSEED